MQQTKATIASTTSSTAEAESEEECGPILINKLEVILFYIPIYFFLIFYIKMEKYI